MDSELTRPSEADESQSSKLSSVNPSDMENGVGSDSDSDSDSSNDGESEAAPQVEWLAMGRQRRSTAGNRMKSMLANEEPDSDLELLFAEDENDQGFSDAGDHASDVQMDSSSDDDDNNENDELEGEKELDRQAKERRSAQRKRKAQEAIPAKFRKKVRIDTSNSTPRSSVPPSTPQTNQPRPKKKSERSSWLPSMADLPTRASSRSTTRLSKEQLHAQMEEREAKRLKQAAQMQKKAARLEALKKPPMTQEDRLREAALVEERNSKSLNRWEEAEKQREEERRAKLAALHERTLSGPVISFWSGMGRFGDGWRKGEGIHVVVEEKPKRPKKEKPVKEKGKKKDEAQDVKAENAGDAQPTSAQSAGAPRPQATAEGQAVENSTQSGEINACAGKEGPKQDPAIEAPSKDTVMADAPNGQTPDVTASAETASSTTNANEDAKPTTEVKDTTADVSMADAPAAEGVKQIPAEENGGQQDAAESTEPAPTSVSAGADASGLKPPEPSTKASTGDGKEPVSQTAAPSETTENANPTSAPAPATGVEATPNQKTTEPAAGSAAEGGPLTTTPLQPIENNSLPASKVVSQIQSEAATPQPEQARSPLHGLPTTRDAIIYQNFDENAIRDKNVQTQVLFGRKMGRLPSKFIISVPSKQM